MLRVVKRSKNGLSKSGVVVGSPPTVRHADTASAILSRFSFLFFSKSFSYQNKTECITGTTKADIIT